jgi:hypothetical protein
MNIRRMLIAALMMSLSCGAFAATSEYYTQHNMWIFKGKSSTDNYAVEALVPVNSRVEVLKESGKKMVLALSDSGTKFTVVLNRHSQKKMDDIKARMLGDKPVDLSRFSKSGLDAIKRGEVKPGMTRAEVLVARGYPPEQSTISLDSDSWRYQQSKWNSIIVNFDNGKVTDIKD